MLRAVLVDRFHLKAHIETKTLPVYNLVVTKDGPKFKPTIHPESGAGTSTNDTYFEGHAIPVRDLAVSLAGTLQRTVLDKTNLSGRYDVTLHWTRDGSHPPIPRFLRCLQRCRSSLASSSNPPKVQSTRSS